MGNTTSTNFHNAILTEQKVPQNPERFFLKIINHKGKHPSRMLTARSPAVCPMCHKMSAPTGEGSSTEQVWTSLQSWPVDVTSRGPKVKKFKQVLATWCHYQGSQGQTKGVPVKRGWFQGNGKGVPVQRGSRTGAEAEGVPIWWGPIHYG